VAPLLSVRRGARAIDFYKRALGAEELLRIENDKGEVVARMAVDGAEFWLADESPEHLNFSPESLGGGSVRMVLTVENPDAVFERAVAAGATVDKKTLESEEQKRRNSVKLSAWSPNPRHPRR
jgi:PhnB protein